VPACRALHLRFIRLGSQSFDTYATQFFALLHHLSADCRGCPGTDLKYPSQIYYAPCQPDQAIGSDGFFKKFEGETIDVLELLFRPYHIEIYAPKQRQLNKNQVILHPSAILERKIEEYKSDYRLVPKGEEKRNSAFFRLGQQLSRLALSMEEIERHLIDADYDSSRDVRSVIKQLKTSRYQPKFYHSLVYEEMEKRA
jgi:hypothetical protein